jgi:hypothetical protein
MDLNEMKARNPSATNILHRLLGCEWGRTIGFGKLEENEPCQAQAVQIMVIHDPNSPEQWMFKFCAEHLERVKQETDPHQSNPLDPSEVKN